MALGLAAAALLLAAAPQSRGDETWTAPASGDWSAPSNWSLAVPGPGDNAFILNGGTADITTALDTLPGATCGNLILGDTGSANSGTIQMTGGSLSATYNENVGNWGTGTFNQSGGVNSLVNFGYSLNLANSAGFSGNYILGGMGLLSAPNESVGNYGTGTFNQSGGSNNVNGTLYLGYYSGSSGSYGLSNSGALSVTNAYVGNSGTGTFNQSGGTNSISTSLILGNGPGSSGSYSLSAGSLSAENESVGSFGPGTFSQTGGTNSVTNSLNLGSPTSNGTYNLSGPALLSALGEVVGNSGFGTFNQSGGTNTVTGTGTSPFLLSGGTYNLTAGVLVLPGIQGAGTFNLGGGTLLAGAAFSTTTALTLTGSGGNVNINPGGNAVTFSGVLSGPGGLTASGSGTLTLAGSNTYSGGTTILSSSAVALNNAYAVPNSVVSVNAVNGLLLNTGSGAIATFYVAGLGGTGSVSLTDSSSNPGSNYSATLSIGGNGASSTYDGAVTGSGGLTKTGSGLLVLGGGNTYAGPTTVTASRLKLDFSQPTAPSGGIISASSPLALSGGTLLVQGGGGNDSQTFNNTSLNAGASAIVVNNTKAMYLYLGAVGGVYRSTGSTVDFTLPSLALNNLNGIFTSSTNFDGILGAYATTTGTAGTTWAVSGGASNSITPYYAYTTGNIATATSTQNFQPSGAQNTITSAVSCNTLDLTGALSVTMSGAGVLTLADGGLIGNTTGTISGGTLQPASNGELIVNTPANLTIGSVIAQNGQVTALTKAGSATLVLTGNNTYNGMTTIGAGVLQLGNGTANGTLGASGTVANFAALVFDLPGASTFGGIISGVGTLAQIGSGMLTLTGSNTYTGSTTISAGTLQVGAGGSGATIGSTASILDNGCLAFNHGDAVTFPLVIGGSGSLTQAGTGVLTLLGGNTYTGSTTISGGTLQVGNGGSGASIAGSSGVSDNGSLVFNHVDPITLSAAVSGSGSLAQTGGGVLTLLGSNTYTGGTTISAGMLQVGNGTAASSLGTGTLTDNSLLVFNLPGAASFTGVIGGSGSLTQAGTGILTLTGGNTYAGGTTISAGTLQVGNGGSGAALGSAGGLLDNGSLVFNHTDAVTLSASTAVSGSGSLTQTGTGLLTLLGNNTYSGGTTISAGTLQVGNGGIGASINGTSGVLDNGRLVFNHADPVTLTGSAAVSGSGSLTQTGPGVLTLPGNNTYTGSTSVSGGVLQVGNGGSGEFLASPTVILSNSAALVFSNSDALAYSGVIGGNGSLTETGGGVLTLLGSNTYTGSTTISSGTLQVGNGVVSGASIGGTSSVLLASNGSLVFNLPGATTFGGVVSGAGNLAQGGTGILTLAGTNASSAAVVASAGTLQFGSGGATGLLTGPITVAGGTFVLDRSGTMNNLLSGTGPLVKTGSDTVTLNGSLTGFTGPISVVQGQLVLASAPSASAFAASSGGTLQINGTTVNLGSLPPFATVSAGSGGVIQFNATTVLGSAYTNISAGAGGTVQYQNASVFGGYLAGLGTQVLSAATTNTFNGVTVNNGTVVQQNGPAVFTNVANYGLISGSGGLLLNGGSNLGSGTLTLGGTNNASGWDGNNGGVIIVQSGGLLNNSGGNLASWGGAQIIINSGGTLNADSAGQGCSLNVNGGLLINNGTVLGTTNIGYGATASGSGSSTFGALVVSGGTLAVTSGTMQSSGLLLGNAAIASNAAILGNGVLAATGTIATTATVTPAAGLTLTLANNLSGGGQLIETGQGTLVLAGSDNYGGGTTISSGTLQVGNGGSGAALGGPGVLDNSALVFNHMDALTFSPAVSGNGSLTQTGTGLLVLLGSNTYSGATTVNAGTLQVGNGGSGASIGGTSVVLDNGSLVFNHSNAVTFSPAVGGSGSLTQTGTGLLALLGSNTYAGGTTVSAGTLSVAAAGNLGTGGLLFDGAGTGVLEITGTNPFSSAAAVTLSQTGTFRQDDTAAATLSGAIGGSGSLLKTGAGLLILSGSNHYGGATVVDAGTLEVLNSYSLAKGTNLVVPAGGRFIFGSPVAGAPVESGQPLAASPAAVAAVPEPGTLALLGVAGVVAAAAARRRRKKA
jgi:autotransporter-associated beta strand protein